MQAERTALSTAAVKREIRKIVADRGHKLGSFDRHGLATCEHCKSVMVDDDARDHLERGRDTLGSFDLDCPQDDPAALILWHARMLREGEALAIPGIDTWIARTNSGLRAGFGWMSLTWPRGDAEALVREQVAVQLDQRQVGYFAQRNRGEVRMWLAKPTATRLMRVGSRAPIIVRDYSRSLA